MQGSFLAFFISDLIVCVLFSGSSLTEMKFYRNFFPSFCSFSGLFQTTFQIEDQHTYQEVRQYFLVKDGVGSKWPPVHKLYPEKESRSRSAKSLQTTFLCYSNAKSTLKVPLTFNKVEKTKLENFNFVQIFLYRQAELQMYTVYGNIKHTN